MKKLYIYPSFDPKHDKTGNTYIRHFHDAFCDSSVYRVVNRLPSLQVFSMPLNLDAEVFIIHWVDLIPRKPLGFLQCLVFYMTMSLVSLSGKKIVWVLHNKRPHSGVSRKADRLMSYMARKSDVVITHSEEGVRFFRQTYPECNPDKCRYIPHPVYSSGLYPSAADPMWDYVVWGTIDRRKNILEFVRFAAGDERMKGKRILICGRCRDEEYDSMIRSSLSENITYDNRFLTDDELAEYISASRSVLFTYNPKSVLSSGALIYTLNFCKPVIGPRAGSFSDLSDIVACFDSFDDIPEIVLPKDPASASKDYIRLNSWSSFVPKLDGALR